MTVRLELVLATPTDGMVRGSVLVREGGRSRSLEVVLAYREYRGKAKRPTGTGWEHRERLHTGNLEGGATFDFTLTAPASPFPDYVCAETGTRLRWEVEAKVDQQGLDERLSVHVDLAGREKGH